MMNDITITKADKSVLVTVRLKKQSNSLFLVTTCLFIGILAISLLIIFEAYHSIIEQVIIGFIMGASFLIFKTYRNAVIEESILLDLDSSLIKLVKTIQSGIILSPRIIPLV